MTGTKLQRRHFMTSTVAAGVAAAMPQMAFGATRKKIKHKPLDPVNPDILFGTTSSIWGGAGVGAKQTHDTPWAIKRVSELGLQGI